MRLIIVIAGAFGFITVILGSMAWNRPFDVSLVNGIISAFVAAILLRWWMRIWILSLEQVSRQDEMSIQLDEIEAQISTETPEQNSSESSGRL